MDQPPSIFLLGASGYVGGALLRAIEERGYRARPVRRGEADLHETGPLRELLERERPAFLVNAAGYTGKPNVDACELHRADALAGNAVLPGRVREACEATGTPWGHVSSGCIYSGRRPDGRPFTEEDEPNFSFRRGPCSFYSGTKALGEEVLEGARQCYVWRLRIPFDDEDSPRNYLVKLLSYPRLLEAENSISHLGEFARACLDLWEQQAPFGTYNLTQPGAITTREVTEALLAEGQRRESLGLPNPFPSSFSFFSSEEEFMRTAARTPRSNTVLSPATALAAGASLTPLPQLLPAVLPSLRR